MSSPLGTLHNRIVQSSDPETKHFPSLEKKMLNTEPEWPMKVLISSPLETLHKLMVISLDPEAKNSEFLENASAKTESE